MLFSYQCFKLTYGMFYFVFQDRAHGFKCSYFICLYWTNSWWVLGKWIFKTRLTVWMIPCFCSNKITYSKQSTFNILKPLSRVSGNFESTCVNFCIQYASNFKVFSIKMFFVISTKFFTIQTLVCKTKQPRIRSPGNMLYITLLSIF